ncbi:hypothetical protein RvY_17402 [Ramazzottius varieornatus]|uniref:TLDc domain-containing protein n=1 Tax=Ramazzottius varieornatus TaxID=947166 RepID=A0A1D1W481_RAMVA|nr:hypothetical protein RvY_17402 [Ramazzottius varieornatus]
MDGGEEKGTPSSSCPLSADPVTRRVAGLWLVNASTNQVDTCGRQLDYANGTQLEHAGIHSTTQIAQAVFPILLILGTVGNFFYIHTFMREIRRKSLIVYLTSLCLANVFVLWLHIPGYAGTYFPKVQLNMQYMDAMERTLGILVWVQQTIILMSSWILIASIVERLLLPTKWRISPAKTKAKQAVIVCIVLSIVAVVVSIPHVVFYQRALVQMQEVTNGESTSCRVVLLVDWFHKYTRVHQSSGLFHYELIVQAITFTVLLLVFVALSIVRLAGERDASQGVVPTWTMLHRSCILYFVTQLPDLLFTFTIRFASYPSCAISLSEDFIALWWPVVSMICLLNYAINFFLYIGSLTDRLVKSQSKAPRIVTPRTADYELRPLKSSRSLSAAGLFRRTPKTSLTVPAEPALKKNKSSTAFLLNPVGTILAYPQFQELWLFLPFRNRIYQPFLIFSTDENGTSISNFLATVSGYSSTIMVVKTMKGEIFGAFCGSSWGERTLGKREYLFFGTGETFLFVFDPKLRLYPWVGLCGRRTTAESSLFLAADSHNLSIGGGGGGMAIGFEGSLARGFSSPCLTFDNAPLCERGEFETSVMEVYGFSDQMEM